MADAHLRQGPLALRHLEARALLAPAAAEIELSDRGFRGQLALRGDASRATFRQAVKRVLGVEPPVEPNTVAGPRRGVSLLWLGPDEWLAVLPDAGEAKALAGLEGALAGEHHLVSDVSNSRAIIGLAGPRARSVLMKGCHLDLHPRAFGAGRCAQSTLARCHVLLHQVDDAPAYDLYVHRSFADYAWRWLEEAGAEYGVRVVAGGA